MPAYVVFSDATLAEMAARKPSTDTELLEVSGVGQSKLQRYGDAFLEAIAGSGGAVGGARLARLTLTFGALPVDHEAPTRCRLSGSKTLAGCAWPPATAVVQSCAEVGSRAERPVLTANPS